MSSFVKKLMATGAALSVGISSFAVADYYNNNNTNNNFGYCEPVPASCNPCGNWVDNLSFDAAWLYWKVSGDDFQYAVDKTRSIVGSAGTGLSLSESREKFHEISFDLDSGFRIGMGFDMPSTSWGAYVDWTHFHSSDSNHKSVLATTPATTSVGFPVLAGFTSDLGTGDVADFNAQLKFKYDTVDIEFGKWASCGCVSFRPHAGFRLADIKERFRDSVVGTGTAFPESYTSAAWEHENRFKGFGVRVGLDTDFNLCEGWSIIGRGAASAIWGITHLKNALALSSATVTNVDVDYIKDDYHQTRFITDLSLGLRYKTMACGCYPLTIVVAWEHHYLFNQHRYWVDDAYGATATTSSWRSSGDVALQGLTLSAGFDF